MRACKLPCTKRCLFSRYKKLKKKLGRQPKVTEFVKESGCCGLAVLKRQFGIPTWNSFLAIVGDKPLRRRIVVTQEDVIKQICFLRAKLGRLPKKTEFMAQYGYDYQILWKTFGSKAWEKLLGACGEKYEPLSRKHLIADFLSLQQTLGRRPKLIEYTYRCHTPKVLDRYFGRPGWRKLINAVGEAALPKNVISAEHLIGDFNAATRLLGKKPTLERFTKITRHTIKPVMRVFGPTNAWSNLVAAAGKSSQ